MNEFHASSSKLPPLKALRAFEAAGRHQSFNQAGEELHVSASAVGHLVADLEAFFGCQLFVRHHRRVELTPAGLMLLPGMRTAFDQLRDGVRSFHNARREGPLVVSVEPTFAVRCLIGRLERFRSRRCRAPCSTIQPATNRPSPPRPPAIRIAPQPNREVGPQNHFHARAIINSVSVF